MGKLLCIVCSSEIDIGNDDYVVVKVGSHFFPAHRSPKYPENNSCLDVMESRLDVPSYTCEIAAIQMPGIHISMGIRADDPSNVYAYTNWLGNRIKFDVYFTMHPPTGEVLLSTDWNITDCALWENKNDSLDGRLNVVVPRDCLHLWETSLNKDTQDRVRVKDFVQIF